MNSTISNFTTNCKKSSLRGKSNRYGKKKVRFSVPLGEEFQEISKSNVLRGTIDSLLKSTKQSYVNLKEFTKSVLLDNSTTSNNVDIARNTVASKDDKSTDLKYKNVDCSSTTPQFKDAFNRKKMYYNTSKYSGNFSDVIDYLMFSINSRKKNIQNNSYTYSNIKNA